MLASRSAQPVPCELDAITSNRREAPRDEFLERRITLKPDRTWPPSHLDTVLFDLDDTLIDSFEARVAALERVFANFDIRGHSRPASSCAIWEANSS